MGVINEKQCCRPKLGFLNNCFGKISFLFTVWQLLCVLLVLLCVAATVVADDLNGDGKDDVLLRHEDGRWFYYPMDGRRHIVGERGLADLTRNRAWQFAGIGDLNGDGKDDVLLRHEDGRWFYYPMDGRRHIVSGRGQADLTSNLAWQFAGIGDLNGDGKDDVLLRHEDGRWFYYPMDGRRHFTAESGQAGLTSNLAWQFAGIGDLNGDGKDDVLLRHEDGRWFYYSMDGRRPIISERGLTDLTRNLAWQFAGIGDLNGDGKDDVLLRNEDGRWWYYPMDGRRHIVSGRGLADLTRNLAWQFVGIGDLNGDGRDDVLVRNDDGRWFYYPMDGRRHIVSQRGLADLTRNLAWSIAGAELLQGGMDGDGGDTLISTEPEKECNVLVDNIGTDNGYIGSTNIGLLGDNVYGNRENIQSFVTGTDRGGYIVTAIEVPLSGIGPGAVTVLLRRGMAPGPGTAATRMLFSPSEEEEEEEIYTFEPSPDNSENSETYVFTTHAELEERTWYHIAMFSDGSDLGVWGYTVSKDEGSCFGWRIGDSSSWRIRDSTPQEVYEGRIGNYPLRFELRGNKRTGQ